MAPLIDGATKAILQSEQQYARLFCSPLVPDTLWTARISNADIEIGETEIAFDGGNGIAVNLIRANSEVWIGTEAGADDVGRGRVRGLATDDGGVTGTVSIAPNSFQLVDNLYLTFKFDFPIKPRYSYIDPLTETFYKDYDIPYTDQNSFPPPVCIAGPHRAGFVRGDVGYWEVNIDLTESYAMTEGASIVAYDQEILALPGNSATTNFDSGTGKGYIRFHHPGNYWVKYTVTDSNGKEQQTLRWYRAHINVPTSPHYPLVDFSLSLSGSWQDGGWQAGINARDGFGIDEFPDRALVVIWQDSYYDGQQQVVSRLPDEAPNLFTGYVASSDDVMDLADGVAQADFQLYSADGVLKNLYGFSLSLRAVPGTVDAWYLYEEWLTTGRAVHHMLRWHTTLLECTDVRNLNLDTMRRVGAMAQDGSIYNICQNLSMEQGIRARLVADHGGRIWMAGDVQLMVDDTRAGLPVVMDIEKADRSGPIAITRAPTRTAPFVSVSGISFDGTFEDGDEMRPNIEDYCAQAPGAFAHDGGANPSSLDNQLFLSQEHANEIAGRLDAQVNNPIPEVSITFQGNYLSVFEPLHSEFYTLTLQTGDTARGVWTGQKKLILRHVDGELDSATGLIRATCTFEPEAVGHDGVATECPGLPELGGIPDLPPIEAELGGALMTAASVHYLPPISTDWNERTAEATNHLIADPWWQTRQESFASAKAIVWRCGDGYIKRSTDAGQNWDDVTPVGSFNGVNAADIEFFEVAVDAAFLGTFVCGGRYHDGNEWISWLFHTNDDGTNWTYAMTG